MQPGFVIRDYVLEEKIGEGGMGEVWRSRHRLLDKPVAIKVMAAQLLTDPQFEARFIQEAQAQARLQHPQIIGATDFFREQGRYYLVMPMIEGWSLDQRLTRGPLPVDEALRISIDALAALDYAHQRAIIHRDVKPSNILIDRDGRAYLTDFGIALMVGQERRTRTGAAIGTPHYMSPEQIRRPRGVDHRTDVYSFGCVLYEMLAGKPPFDVGDSDEETDYAIKEAHVHQPPEPVRRRHPSVPEAVEAIVMRALAKSPDERFVSCGEFARAIQAYQSGRPIPFSPSQSETRDVKTPPGRTPTQAESRPTPSATPEAHKTADVSKTAVIAPSERQRFVTQYALVSVFAYALIFAGHATLDGELQRAFRTESHLLLGVCSGAIVGLLQWVVLRRYLKTAGWFFLATFASWTLFGLLFQFAHLPTPSWQLQFSDWDRNHINWYSGWGPYYWEQYQHIFSSYSMHGYYRDWFGDWVRAFHFRQIPLKVIAGLSLTFFLARYTKNILWSVCGGVLAWVLPVALWYLLALNSDYGLPPQTLQFVVFALIAGIATGGSQALCFIRSSNSALKK